MEHSSATTISSEIPSQARPKLASARPVMLQRFTSRELAGIGTLNAKAAQGQIGLAQPKEVKFGRSSSSEAASMELTTRK
jgi:hypothetical protein